MSLCLAQLLKIIYFWYWPEEGVGSPETGVRDGCELPCGWYGSSSGPGKAASARSHLAVALTLKVSNVIFNSSLHRKKYVDIFKKNPTDVNIYNMKLLNFFSFK